MHYADEGFYTPCIKAVANTGIKLRFMAWQLPRGGITSGLLRGIDFKREAGCVCSAEILHIP